jgi:hypothetical protein
MEIGVKDVPLGIGRETESYIKSSEKVLKRC